MRTVSNMKSKTGITLVIKIIALTFALLIIQAVASQVAGLNTSLQQEADPAVAGKYALLTSFLFAIVLSHPIVRSAWSGWKLVLTIAIAFGQFVFIPLAGDAFEEYYAGLEMPQWILLLQAVRALIWVALAIPVIRMMKGPWWEAGLAVALLFSVLMGALLLIPQDIMPDKIRLAHFAEVTSSNFLFGWLVVFILNWQRPLKRQIGTETK